MNFKSLSWLVSILLFTSTILSIFSIVSSIIGIIQIDLNENKTDSDKTKIYFVTVITLSALIFIMNLVILYHIYKYYGTDEYYKGRLFEKKKEVPEPQNVEDLIENLKRTLQDEKDKNAVYATK